MSSSVSPIRIGGRNWLVMNRPAADLPGLAGQCDYPSATLDIAEGQSLLDETDTVLHEIFHAILYCQGREQGGKVEETYVRALATGLIAVLYDNPQFARWLCRRVTAP